MANSHSCHAGDIVLLRADVIGVGSDGPYVRIRTGSGRATCFWAPTASVAQIERAFDEPNESIQLSRLNSCAGASHPSRYDELGTRTAQRWQS
jgi:hypothetical protein